MLVAVAVAAVVKAERTLRTLHSRRMNERTAEVLIDMVVEQLVGIADEGTREQKELGCTNTLAVLHQDEDAELPLHDARLRDDQI